MAEYSKEWVKKNNSQMNYDFTFSEEFYKLKEGKEIKIICEGFGIIGIKNDDGECKLIDRNNTLKSYREVIGEELEEKESYKSLITLFICIAIVWVIAWILIVKIIPEDSDAGMSRGTFGDMFGSVNALFSGLALGGIIFTIMLQRKELKLQRKELKETRKEFSIQNNTLKRQRFENTFFQMLNLHHEIIDKLQNGKRVKRVLFSDSVGDIIYNFSTYGPSDESMSSLKKNIEYVYRKSFEDSFENSLSHYFRNIYHIFKYIYKSNLISDSEKYFYAGIIRAQLSPDELYILYYNSIVDGLGNPKFLFLVKEYNIFKNMNPKLINKDHKRIMEDLVENITNPFSNE